ncbi:hypothetical protein [Mesorhizobium sp. 1M-11]|uniref:hypothetical protein n=1 Tax=Mesorhizobium sp. 1M-11 TaxID=1529006 RepID=UPI0006C75A0A|nr:hypothetical protein [Mesorhizobium sp. 1M-11]
MVTAISRLASLLKQATAGDVPLQTARSDPAKAALIRTLATPRPPLGAEPMASLAPPLVVPAGNAAAQKEASSRIIEAYRAAFELQETETSSIGSRPSLARGADAETGPQPLSGQPVARDDAASSIRAQPMPAYALALPLSAAAGQARTDEVAIGRRRPAQAKATREKSKEVPLKAVFSGRALGFGLAAFALLLLVVLLVF